MISINGDLVLFDRYAYCYHDCNGCVDGRVTFLESKPGLDSRERRLSSALRLLISLLRQSVKEDIPTQVVRRCEEGEKANSSSKPPQN